MRIYYRELFFIVNCIISVLVGTTALFQIGALSEAVSRAASVSTPIFLILGVFWSDITPYQHHNTLANVSLYNAKNSSNGSLYKSAFCLYIYSAQIRVFLGTLALLFFCFCSGCYLLTILLCAYYFFYSN